MPSDLDGARYISFVSYKRDGTPVALPVWIAPFEDGYAFTTDLDAWKVKRVRNNPEVTVQVCNLRGTVRAGTIVHRATAEVVEGERALAVRAVVKRKYFIAYRLLISLSDWRQARRSGSPTAGVAAIVFRVSEPDAPAPTT